MLDLADPSSAHELFVLRVTPIEVAAALFRRVRGGTLSQSEASAALSVLRLNLQRTLQVIEINPSLTETAMELAERRGLRGYDCIQLAGALLTHGLLTLAEVGPLTLVSADDELNTAAAAEGLQVENPNVYS